MPPESDWYRDESRLLTELQRTRSSPPRIAIEGYDDLRELRRGGQGVVYTATQRSTRRQVAIKVLLDGAFASPSARRRFEREVELIAGLRHPNIVQVYDSGVTADDHLYYVMEYIDGSPLDALIPNFSATRSAGGKSVTEERERVYRVLALFAKVCDAVSAAHLRGVIHRDLKPGNIRIDSSGEPRVLDFGLAKLASESLAGAAATAVSRTGEFMGSLPWASPEQTTGRSRSIDTRTDVYSLGVLLFQMLTGCFPYDVTGPLPQVLQTIANEPPLRPRSLRPLLDEDVETIVLKCLSKEPARRYQSAGELARDIRRQLAGEPIEARRDSAWYVLRKSLRRYRLAAGVTVAVLVLSIGFGVSMLFLWQRAVQAEGQARGQALAALEARDAERAALRSARDEAEKARQTLDVLTKMITSADPLRGRRDVTVREVLDRTAQTAAADFDGRPELEATIRMTLASTYGNLGLYEQAEAQARAALALRDRTLGDEHPDTLQARDSLAQQLAWLGRSAEALAMFRALREVQVRVLGAKHPQTLTTLNNMGVTMAAIDPRECEALLEAALAGRREALGPEHEDTLVTMSNLAWRYADTGRFAEAENLYRTAYDVQRATKGPDHPSAINVLANLATLLDRTGRIAEAEPLAREVLARQTAALGPEHQNTLTAMSNLAYILDERNLHDEAAALYRDALEISQRVYGERAPQTQILMNNLAHVLQQMGRLGEAAPLFEAVATIRRVDPGPDHPNTLLSIGNLAMLYQAQGRTPEARALLVELVAAYRRVRGNQHSDTLIALNNLAGLYAGPDELPQAEALQREAVAGAAATLGAEHWMTAAFRGNLGKTLLLMQKYLDAERELLEAYRVLAAVLGRDNPKTVGVLERILDLYTAWQRPLEMERYRALHPRLATQPAADDAPESPPPADDAAGG